MLMCQYANWLRYYSEFPYDNRYAIMPKYQCVKCVNCPLLYRMAIGTLAHWHIGTSAH